MDTLGTLATLTQDKPGTPWQRVGLLVPAASAPVVVNVRITQHWGEPGWTDNLVTATPSWRVASARLGFRHVFPVSMAALAVLNRFRLGKEHAALKTSINQQVAAKLREAADVLEQQAANPFRVGAYRRAAETIAGLDEDLDALVANADADALIELPNIGTGISAAIHEILRTGRWVQLERLRGALDPERLFQTVPGIGPKLAKRIHDHLDVETLEALENAAHDGRLEEVPGVGARRATAIRATLESMLGRMRRQYRREPAPAPSVELLLDVDAEYRNKASSGQLPTISPRRFNPNGEAWLPILHTDRGHWHFTVLFSNTARAHDLGRTRDWVVVYFYDEHHREGQCTVVTETRGALMGKRVVRGREDECRVLYAE